MDDRLLPKIRLNDAYTDGMESPFTATDVGRSPKPRSTTSSDGNNTQQAPSKKSAIKLMRNNTSSRETNGASPTSPTGRPPSVADPLSHAILTRQSTTGTLLPQKLRSSNTPEIASPDLGAPTTPDIPTPERRLTFNKQDIIHSDNNPAKEKKKGVSFLSRFSIIGGKKKDLATDPDSDEEELGDPRTEGMNAHVFSSSVGANGFIPQHKEPPRYIKVRSHNKKNREFNRMFLAQELSGTRHPLGEGGSEKVVRINTSEVDGNSNTYRSTKPEKDSGAVWSIEFSNDGKYLAAAGRDQIVRVWAVISTPEEREAHEHEEDVSSDTNGGERLSAPVFRSKPEREFAGHTGDVLDLSWSKNDFLLSSSMDKTVKLWHVSRAECLCTFKHKDFVTSIAFHPTDDRFFLAGSLDSILRLWSIPDKSVAFWNQLPDLITAVAFSPDGKTAIAGLLSGMACFYETEGLKFHTQIHVRSSRGKNAKGSKITGIRTITFPPDDPEGEVKVLITSNDSRVRLYNLRDKNLEMKFRGHENTCSQINASFSDDARYVICGSEDRKAYVWNIGNADAENKDKRSVEFFEAHSDMVTAAVILPAKSRHLLSASGDPIYDLCNPPPVTLLSREESHTGSEKRRSMIPTGTEPFPQIEKSPAYLARASHNDGLIIVTGDYLGVIKVFRSDCAQKRRQESLETASSFSKKMLGRSNSMMTRNSSSSISRRNSIAHGPPAHTDHILNWRRNIDNSSIKSATKTTRSDRSVSPVGKFQRTSFQSQSSLASVARQQPYTRTTSVSTTSPPGSIRKGVQKAPTKVVNNTYQIPTPGFSLYSSSKGTNQFWNVGSWRSQDKSTSESGQISPVSLMPPSDRGDSVVSTVSMLSSDDAGEGERRSIKGLSDEESDDVDDLICRKCSGKEFRARRVVGKEIVMVCRACGTMVE